MDTRARADRLRQIQDRMAKAQVIIAVAGQANRFYAEDVSWLLDLVREGDVLRSRLTELIEHWRSDFGMHNIWRSGQCADELEKLLPAPPESQL